jgi:hypothetical protein
MEEKRRHRTAARDNVESTMNVFILAITIPPTALFFFDSAARDWMSRRSATLIATLAMLAAPGCRGRMPPGQKHKILCKSV